MTIQLFRPVNPPEGCHCYGVVIDDGDAAFEFYDSEGTLHEDIGAFNEDTTGHAEWVEHEPKLTADAAGFASWLDTKLAELTGAQFAAVLDALTTERRRRGPGWYRDLKSRDANNPDVRRGVLGADGADIGEVWLDGEEWHARYAKLTVAGFDENPPAFGTKDAAIAWVLTQDRPRIAALHAASKGS